MKIKITTDRQPWVHDQPQPMGAELEVSQEQADSLVKQGFAEIVAAPKRASKNADA